MVSKKLNLIDQRFGNLLVVKSVGNNSMGSALWECKCDCGQLTIASSATLKAGNKKSCGCLRRIDVTNKRFGIVTVLEYVGSSINGKSLWKCKCDCGKIFTTSSDSIQSISSCGCSRRLKLIGKKFGLLTVTKYLKQIKEQTVWECLCICGETVVVSSADLTRRKRSCGKCKGKNMIYYKLFNENYYEAYMLKPFFEKKSIDLSLFETQDIEIAEEDMTLKGMEAVKTLGKPDFIFDKEFIDDISSLTWYKHRNNIISTSNKETITLQRFIMGLVVKDIENKFVTFKVTNKDDYRISNLLFKEKGFIGQKYVKHSNKCGYKGVFEISNKYTKYGSRINFKGKSIYIGTYDTPESAALAYNIKALKLYGKNAYQNKTKQNKIKNNVVED